MKISPKTDMQFTIGIMVLLSVALILLRNNGILLPKWLVISAYSVAAVNLVVMLVKMKGSKSCKSSCNAEPPAEPPSS